MDAAGFRQVGRFLRALLAGGAATIVDMVVLALLVSAAGVSPRLANVPALIVGGVVSFFANRHWVFRARHGPLPEQATLYVLVELVALAGNGILFDAVMRLPLLALHAGWYAPARLVTSHVVFLVWSYPLWRFVFRARPRVL
jgi:putative flippase GtrA